MRTLFLLLLASTHALASSAPLTLSIKQGFSMSKSTKWTSFRHGQRIDKLLFEKQGGSCNIENTRLERLEFKKGQKLALQLERLSFPNEKVVRVRLYSDRGGAFDMACDFTGLWTPPPFAGLGNGSVLSLSEQEERKFLRLVNDEFGRFAKAE